MGDTEQFSGICLEPLLVRQEIIGQQLSIVPQPNEVIYKSGDGFKIDANTAIVVNVESRSIGERLQSLLKSQHQLSLNISEARVNKIAFLKNDGFPE